MSRRTEMVGDEIQRVLGEVIHNEVKDPRVGFVTVTGVTVTPDLGRANVRLSIMGDEVERKEAMRALEHARGFLRRRIGEEVTLRTVPQLVLHLDTSLDHALRIGDVLREIDAERERNPPQIDDVEGEASDQ
jgi:ribosome-binding factor A